MGTTFSISPVQPQTLGEQLDTADSVVRIHNRISTGKGFMDPGNRLAARQKSECLRNQMREVFDLHPDIIAQYALLDELHDQTDNPQAMKRVQELRAQIIEIEQNVVFN